MRQQQKMISSRAHVHCFSLGAVWPPIHIPDNSSQRYWNVHLLLFITPPPLSSTCCDNIGGWSVEIATQERCLTYRRAAAAISCQLRDPASSFVFFFLFDFLFHQVCLYQAGQSLVILRWQTLIWVTWHKGDGRMSVEVMPWGQLDRKTDSVCFISLGREKRRVSAEINSSNWNLS